MTHGDRERAGAGEGARGTRWPGAIGVLVLVAMILLPLRQEPAVLQQAHAGGPAPRQASPTGPDDWPASTHPSGRVRYAAPQGRPGNPGTAARPLDLATALSADGPLHPGDVLWLRKGTYRGNFRSALEGRAGAPIVVAQYPGERAVLDGAAAPEQSVLRVDGAHAIYWGFEVTNSAPQAPDAGRGAGIDVFGAYTKFIHLVVHHTGNGIGLWTPALAAEVYGCVIYQSGWDGADRGHGHSIYVQNDAPDKRIVDNVLFDGHSFGIHAYTQEGAIDNLHIEGNIVFDHGTASRVSGPTANILVGGWRVAHQPVLVSNFAYYPERSSGRNADIGYIAGCADAVITGNYFAGGSPLVVTRCRGLRVEGNTLVGRADRSLAARFPANDFVSGRPGESRVFVRPSRYRPGRSNVAIFNWERRASLPVDLSGTGLRPGDRFEIRDARNFFAAPLWTGLYGNHPIDLPLTRLRESGGVPGLPGAAPEFGAAIVLPLSTGLAQGLPWMARQPVGRPNTRS